MMVMAQTRQLMKPHPNPWLYPRAQLLRMRSWFVAKKKPTEMLNCCVYRKQNLLKSAGCMKNAKRVKSKMPGKQPLNRNALLLPPL